jgi:hypothetical protein
MLSSWRMYEMHPALSFKTGCYNRYTTVQPLATEGTCYSHMSPLPLCGGLSSIGPTEAKLTHDEAYG